jgi:hypothetical protein
MMHAAAGGHVQVGNALQPLLDGRAAAGGGALIRVHLRAQPRPGNCIHPLL